MIGHSGVQGGFDCALHTKQCWNLPSTRVPKYLGTLGHVEIFPWQKNTKSRNRPQDSQKYPFQTKNSRLADVLAWKMPSPFHLCPRPIDLSAKAQPGCTACPRAGPKMSICCWQWPPPLALLALVSDLGPSLTTKACTRNIWSRDGWNGVSTSKYWLEVQGCPVDFFYAQIQGP